MDFLWILDLGIRIFERAWQWSDLSPVEKRGPTLSETGIPPRHDDVLEVGKPEIEVDPAEGRRILDRHGLFEQFGVLQILPVLELTVIRVVCSLTISVRKMGICSTQRPNLTRTFLKNPSREGDHPESRDTPTSILQTLKDLTWIVLQYPHCVVDVSVRQANFNEARLVEHNEALVGK